MHGCISVKFDSVERHVQTGEGKKDKFLQNNHLINIYSSITKTNKAASCSVELIK